MKKRRRSDRRKYQAAGEHFHTRRCFASRESLRWVARRERERRLYGLFYPSTYWPGGGYVLHVTGNSYAWRLDLGPAGVNKRVHTYSMKDIQAAEKLGIALPSDASALPGAA